MFLIAKMSQDLVYDVLFFNTRNDSHRTTAPATDLDVPQGTFSCCCASIHLVYVEHTFQSLSPGHCGVVLNR
jgi:hypothetical protein